MGESSPGTPSFSKPPEDRLDSWKEIASHLNRDVTTVQRWEKREGMPVHRHQHDRSGSVYAYCSELDAWQQSRKLRLDEERVQTAELSANGGARAEPTAPLPVRRRLVLGGLAALALLTLAYAFTRSRGGCHPTQNQGAGSVAFEEFEESVGRPDPGVLG